MLGGLHTDTFTSRDSIAAQFSPRPPRAPQLRLYPPAVLFSIPKALESDPSTSLLAVAITLCEFRLPLEAVLQFPGCLLSSDLVRSFQAL